MIFYSDYASDINNNADIAVAVNTDIKYNHTTDVNFRFKIYFKFPYILTLQICVDDPLSNFQE